MRTIVAITNMIPDLSKRLACMYKDLVKESKNKITLNRSHYFKAEVYYEVIVRELNCAPDVNKVNFYLNELLSALENCKDIVVTPGDTIVLQCNTNRQKITFWVADETECEQANYNVYATISSFTIPDLVVGIIGQMFEVILLAETGVNKQYIQVQKSYADSNPLSEVYYFNPSINAYMPTNKIADWTPTIITKTGVQYIQYTYSGPKRGSTKTKFVL